MPDRGENIFIPEALVAEILIMVPQLIKPASAESISLDNG